MLLYLIFQQQRSKVEFHHDHAVGNPLASNFASAAKVLLILHQHTHTVARRQNTYSGPAKEREEERQLLCYF